MEGSGWRAVDGGQWMEASGKWQLDSEKRRKVGSRRHGSKREFGPRFIRGLCVLRVLGGSPHGMVARLAWLRTPRSRTKSKVNQSRI
jgi:hypothetical protein